MDLSVCLARMIEIYDCLIEFIDVFIVFFPDIFLPRFSVFYFIILVHFFSIDPNILITVFVKCFMNSICCWDLRLLNR